MDNSKADKLEEIEANPKEKWQLTVDFLMIVGKYYKSNNETENEKKIIIKN